MPAAAAGDHAVLAVGYGTDGGKPYYIEEFMGSVVGWQGYMRLAFNEDACNIAACSFRTS